MNPGPRQGRVLFRVATNAAFPELCRKLCRYPLSKEARKITQFDKGARQSSRQSYSRRWVLGQVGTNLALGRSSLRLSSGLSVNREHSTFNLQLPTSKFSSEIIERSMFDVRCSMFSRGYRSRVPIGVQKLEVVAAPEAGNFSLSKEWDAVERVPTGFRSPNARPIFWRLEKDWQNQPDKLSSLVSRRARSACLVTNYVP